MKLEDYLGKTVTDDRGFEATVIAVFSHRGTDLLTTSSKAHGWEIHKSDLEHPGYKYIDNKYDYVGKFGWNVVATAVTIPGPGILEWPE